MVCVRDAAALRFCWAVATSPWLMSMMLGTSGVLSSGTDMLGLGIVDLINWLAPSPTAAVPSAVPSAPPPNKLPIAAIVPLMS